MAASSACRCGSRDGARMLRYMTGPPPPSVLGLYCQNCGREWLTKRDLRNDFDAKQFIVDSGVQFFLNQRRQTLSKANEDGIHMRREQVSDPSRLKAGDHLQWDEGDVSNHAIVVNQSDCVRFKKSGFCRIEIIRCHLDDITSTSRTLIRYEYDEEDADRVALVVARAETWVGAGGTNLFTKNTKSFAIYCKIGALFSWTTIWFLGSFMSCVHEISTDSFWGTGKEKSFSECLDGLRLDAAAGRDVSVGFVIAADASPVIFDLHQLYTDRTDPRQSRDVFLEKELGKIMERINKAGFTIESATGVTGTPATHTIATLMHHRSDTVVPFIAWSINNGEPVGFPERICGTTLGRSFGKFITMTVKYDDRLVGVDDIRRGDQIVMCAWFFHPRCHVIVLGVDVGKRVLKVIRNTQKKGVIEESLEFVQPVYRVTYAARDRRPVDDIIKRAKSKLGTNEYNLLSFNCKHFAEWCVQW